MYDAYTANDDLNTIYAAQESGTLALINGQSEQNVPTGAMGTIHFVLSYCRNALYGYQYLFGSAHIFYRSMSNGSWGNWIVFV